MADWNAKVGSQEIPGVTVKFGRGVQNEAGQRLIEFCQQNALIIKNTLFQHKRRLYTWTSPDGRHQNQFDYILCSQRWRSSHKVSKTNKQTKNKGVQGRAKLGVCTHIAMYNIDNQQGPTV